MSENLIGIIGRAELSINKFMQLAASMDFWALIVSIATFIVLALTIVYTRRELSAIVILRILNELGSYEMRGARRFVLNGKLPPLDKAKNHLGDYEILNEVWASFDHIGLLVSFRLVSKKMVLEMYYGTIIKCWEKLEPYIMKERRDRKGRYQNYFEKLYKMSIKFRDKKYPESKN